MSDDDTQNETSSVYALEKSVREILIDILPTLVWGLSFGVLFLVVHLRASAPVEAGITAARKLVPNTFITTGDVLMPGVTGAYVGAKEISAGAVVSKGELLAQPLPPPADTVSALLSVPISATDIVMGVNAGRDMRLCAKTDDLGLVVIQSVHCDPSRVSCAALATVQNGTFGALVSKGAMATPGDLHLAQKCGG